VVGRGWASPRELGANDGGWASACLASRLARRIALLVSLTLLGLSVARLIYHTARLTERT
jgi:hypothetical protein